MTSLQDTVTVVMDVPTGVAAETVTIPRRIGTVKIGDQIGRGGNGVVFAAFDDALNRRVAVKLLHQLRGTQWALERGYCMDGVRAAARVRHDNLVMVHNVDLLQDIPIIVMELVDGRSVRELLAARHHFDVPTSLYIAREICRGVEALHAEQIIHRDLKPANVLIDRSGRPRVCDFGLACEVDSTLQTRRTSAVAGSPYFMAPEVFDGVISPQADVYAIGVILFEMLTGQLPFPGDTIELVRQKHKEQDPPLELLAALKLGEELTELVERALHKQRILRYKTAGHLLRALEQIETHAREDLIRSRLADMIESLHGTKTGPDDRTPATPPGGTYEMLSQRAAAKRLAKPGEGS